MSPLDWYFVNRKPQGISLIEKLLSCPFFNLPSKITCFEKKYIKIGKNSMRAEYVKTVLKGVMAEGSPPLLK